ncbi:MAG TPA: glycine--tRNA ligase subunit beta, partial [Idiomarina sp.]|nr:glycine--tRNA ligase subunit beta [Idiomarina sp.]
MNTDNLIVELGTEELPPKALKNLSEAFAQGIMQGLQQNELQYNNLRALATPRRLAVSVEGLQAQQADRVVEKRGPS